MKEKILKYVVQTIIENFLGNLNEQEIREELDHWIDRIELRIEQSENQLDDSILPVLRFARTLFGIPDLPDVKI